MSENHSFFTYREKNDQDLSFWLKWRNRLAIAIILYAVGFATACIFAPLEWSWFSWIFLTPAFVYILKRRFQHTFKGTYFFFWGHFTLSFYWLSQVIPPAAVVVAAICAFMPAMAMKNIVQLYRFLDTEKYMDLYPQVTHNGIQMPTILLAKKEPIFILLASAIWVTWEWVRSWVFTGFPWNYVGQAFWDSATLTKLLPYTGIYGLSFVVIIVNFMMFCILYRFYMRQHDKKAITNLWKKPVLYVSLFPLSLCFILPVLPEMKSKGSIRVLAIQGNLEQMRVPSREQLYRAMDVYQHLTIQGVYTEKPDLVLWPETAIPYALLSSDMAPYLDPILNEIWPASLLAGTITYRQIFGEEHEYNSLVLMDKKDKEQFFYDKIHTVPFGEYTPLGDYMPDKLKEHPLFVRGLTAGKLYRILEFKGYKIGFNICYDDAYPDVTYGARRNGAEAIITVSNDAWYRETSGSYQHLTHSVVRAIESGIPTLRNGNNSDTCLILPNGTIVDPLVSPDGNPFYRGFKFYDLPILADQQMTFYVRYGNWFAWLCSLITVVCWILMFIRFYRKKEKLQESV